MKQNLIESIVMTIFGLVILVTGIFTSAGVGIIVLGSLLFVAGIIFLIFSIKETITVYDEYASKVEELREYYEAEDQRNCEEYVELEDKYNELTVQYSAQVELNKTLSEKLNTVTEKYNKEKAKVKKLNAAKKEEEIKK